MNSVPFTAIYQLFTGHNILIENSRIRTWTILLLRRSPQQAPPGKDFDTIVQSLPVLSKQLKGMKGSILPVATATTITRTADKACSTDHGQLRFYEANCNDDAFPLKSQQNQKSYNTDYSRVQAPIKQHNARTKDLLSPLLSKGVSAKELTFPVKLHMILSNPDLEDIITWLPHGRSWTISNHKAFEERIIPLYFRHGRFSSFARQVNGWGFRRVTQGSDYNSYYHEVRKSDAIVVSC